MNLVASRGNPRELHFLEGYSMSLLRKTSGRILAAVALIAACGISAAKANSVTFTTAAANPPGGDGPIQASVVFTAVNGGLQITLTNLEDGSLGVGQGQAISALHFTMAS